MIKSVLMREIKNIQDLNIIDVRENFEHKMGTIKGAMKIPLNSLPTYIQNLDKQQEYYIVCHSGSRSSIASQYLSSEGFNVVNVMGGMSAYRGELDYEV